MASLEEISLYRGRLREIIEEIPSERLSGVLDFLEYIKDREEWEATWEVIRDKKFLEGVQRGKRDIEEGRWRRWEEIRRDV